MLLIALEHRILFTDDILECRRGIGVVVFVPQLVEEASELEGEFTLGAKWIDHVDL